MKRRGESRFLPNTVALVVQTVVTTLLTLLQVKILANWLDKDTFGAFVSLRGFSLLLSIVAANGLPHLLVRFIPAHESDDDYAQARRLSIASLGTCGGVLAGLIGVVILLRSRAFGFAGVAVPETTLLVWFFATTIGVALKMVLYGGLNGLRRLGAQLWLETLTHTAILVWLILARNTLDIVGLFRILGIVHLATLALGVPTYFLVLLLRNGADPHPKRVRQPYGSYLRWAIIMSLVAVAFSDVDRYLLAQILSLELLALFHIGARVGRLANRLLGVATLAFQPEVTRLDKEGRGEAVVTATRIFIKFSSVLAIMVTSAIVVFGKEIVILIANESYVDATVLLTILALSLPLSTVTAPITSVMKARDQIREALWTDIAWASGYVAGMFALAPPLGLVGVGVANVFACIVQLVTALLTSRLAVGWSFVAKLLGRLGALAVVLFLPAYVVTTTGTTVLWLFATKVVVFAAGCIVMHYVLLSSRLPIVGRLYAQEERTMLRALLERSGLGFVRRFV